MEKLCRGGWCEEGICENSVLSAQFFCKLKTALKNQVCYFFFFKVAREDRYNIQRNKDKDDIGFFIGNNASRKQWNNTFKVLKTTRNQNLST